MSLIFVTLLNAGEVNWTKVEPVLKNEVVLGFPKEWKTCEKDSDCKLIRFGCDNKTTVNKRFEDAATEQAYKVGGDPRAMNCVGGQGGLIEVLCKKNICGVYEYPTCNSPECKEAPSCFFEGNIFIDASQSTSSYLGERLWGPTAEICKKKCHARIEAMKAAVKTPEQGKNEVECKFQGKIILKDSFKGLSI